MGKPWMDCSSLAEFFSCKLWHTYFKASSLGSEVGSLHLSMLPMLSQMDYSTHLFSML